MLILPSSGPLPSHEIDDELPWPNLCCFAAVFASGHCSMNSQKWNIKSCRLHIFSVTMIR